MLDWLQMNYLWLKAVHIIAVISWMAGMFYLPRLFVYHCKAKLGSPQSETFKVMEHKLLRIIMNPAMIVTWLVGIAMVYANPDLMSQGWFHAKATMVILMSIVHMMYSKWRRQFANDVNRHDEKFYRWANEAPTILMIAIVILAVIKPF